MKETKYPAPCFACHGVIFNTESQEGGIMPVLGYFEC